MVKLLFKTPSKEQPFEIDADLTVVTNVEQLKQKVADHANSTVPNIKLIHKGKILKDQTPLATLKLVDGETFHAVIKAVQTQTETTNNNQPTSSSNTQNPNLGTGLGGLGGFGATGGLGGLGGYGGLGAGGFGGLGGMGAGGLGGLDPSAMAGMLDQMTPQMMEQAINSNPMLKAMVDSNPQVRAIMSNPQLMKQMVSSMNPAMMQQAMSQMGGLGGLGGYGGLGGFGGLGPYGGLGGGLNPPASTGTGTVNYKELYKSQLQQLQGMGFVNEATNIQALKATGGNVEAAVERLLNMLG